MNYNIVFVGFLFFVLLSFSSCVWKKEVKDMHEWKNYSENFIRDHLNKKVIYPNMTKTDTLVYFYANDRDKHWAKVLINVDIDCKSCLLKFSFWNNLLQSNFIIKRCVALPGDSIVDYLKETHSPWITPFPIVPYKGMRVSEKMLNEIEKNIWRKTEYFGI